MNELAGVSDVERVVAFLRKMGLDPGRIYTFSELDTALGKPIRQHRTTVHRASDRLEKEDQRTLIAVVNVGYRVAYARESVDLARGRRRKAQNQLKRARATLQNTDVSQLTPEERQRLDLHAMAINAMAQAMNKMNRRLTRVEDRVNLIEERPQLSPQEVAFLRGLMQPALAE